MILGWITDTHCPMRMTHIRQLRGLGSLQGLIVEADNRTRNCSHRRFCAQAGVDSPRAWFDSASNGRNDEVPRSLYNLRHSREANRTS
jgi:hypothetical protein